MEQREVEKRCGKEKLPGLSRGSNSPEGVAGVPHVHQCEVRQTEHIPPSQSGAGHPGGARAAAALGTRHVSGAGIDEAGPRHRSGSRPTDRQDRAVGRWRWVK